MRTLLFWLLAGAVLAVAHTIQPLSASNHTTYLLHGLADAGVGYLSEDWLAQTPDMSPAFSVLVRGLHWIAGPYGIRAGFVGVVAAYVWALFRIGAPGAGAIPGRASEWLVLGALVVMHAKLFDDALPREFGGEWARFFSWGFAGQYLLNRMFQPCLFGAALLVGVVLIRRGRVKLGLASAVFASWMHPTYVLSAAALTLAVILEDIRQGRYRRGAVHGLVALVLVAPVLIYVQSTFAGADPELVARAQSLLVHDRIPHHADPRSWFGPRMGLKLVLVVAVLYATRGTSFGRLLTVPTIVAVVGIVVVLLVHSDFLALLFPWRTSVFVVPAASAFLLGRLTTRAGGRVNLSSWPVRAIGLAVVTACLVYGVVLMGRTHARSKRGPKATVWAQARAGATSGQTWWIPLDWKGFRLATGLPAWVDWKSHPYDAPGIIEWNRRVATSRELENGSLGCAEIARVAAEEAITRVVVEGGNASRLRCPAFRQMHSNASFAVFERTVERGAQDER